MEKTRLGDRCSYFRVTESLLIFYMYICRILLIQLLGCHIEINACLMRPPGWHRQSWMWTFEKDLSALSIGPHTAWRRAQDREQWQRIAKAAMLHHRACPWWWWWWWWWVICCCHLKHVTWLKHLLKDVYLTEAVALSDVFFSVAPCRKIFLPIYLHMWQLSEQIHSNSGVTQVGVTRAGNWWVPPYFFLKKSDHRFLVIAYQSDDLFQLSSPHHSHLPRSFIQCSF